MGESWKDVSRYRNPYHMNWDYRILRCNASWGYFSGEDRVKTYIDRQGRPAEAVQFDGTAESAEAIAEFTGEYPDYNPVANTLTVGLGRPVAVPMFCGDWIVREPTGMLITYSESSFRENFTPERSG